MNYTIKLFLCSNFSSKPLNDESGDNVRMTFIYVFREGYDRNALN